MSDASPLPTAAGQSTRRRNLLTVWLLGLLLALFGLQAAAGNDGALVLADDTPALDAWAYVTLFDDPDASTSLKSVLADQASFMPPATPHANLGIRHGAVWLRVPVEVPDGSSARWLLDIDYPSIDRCDVFLVVDGNVAQHLVLGDHLLFADRPLPTRSHAARLALHAGMRAQLLLRVQTTSTAVLPITLQQVDAYYAREASAQALQALLAGVWICLCLYSLTQWAALGDAMFSFYALAIVGTGLFFASYFGVGPQHLWGSSAWLTQNMAPLGVLLGLIGGLLFLDRALDMKSMGWHWSRLARSLAATVALLVLAFVSGAIGYRVAQAAATLFGLTPMLFAVPLSFMRWRRGDRAAMYLLWGWLIYASGAGQQALLLRGVLGADFWTQHAFQFGSTVEMVLWMVVLGVRIDEIRRKAEQARLERDRLHSLAHSDALTGLLNRRGLQAASDPVLAVASPSRCAAIYLLDLDGFKPINDTYGHDAGDELLRQVGPRLKSALRVGDLVARLGGDEFVVVAAALSLDSDAETIGRKMMSAFQQPFEIQGQVCRVGLTIGYAIAPLDGYDLQSLLKRADAALYAGKQAGKNRMQRGAASAGLVAA